MAAWTGSDISYWRADGIRRELWVEVTVVRCILGPGWVVLVGNVYTGHPLRGLKDDPVFDTSTEAKAAAEAGLRVAFRD